MKKLRKSNTDRIIFGIIGGIGEYFNVDPTVLRLLVIVVTVFTAIVPMVIIYIFAALIIPGPLSLSK